MRNKTNVKYLSTEYYYSYYNQVQCYLTYEIDLSKWPIYGFKIDADLLIKIGNTLGMDKYVVEKKTNYPTKFVFTVSAMSKCDENKDTYDKTLGERIALTRAQAKAFEKTCKFYDLIQIELDKSFSEITRAIDNNWHAANKCWDHAKNLGGY